ncbi:two-component system, response regulator YesN [Cohnella sp. OV330]|uniref:response regulator n=1 Tax=Cohnella sp. OV330 TaxID=1855288 RepID=UPI0008E72C3A|nr:response regulator [Cohnella sp. OV330]SFA72975.1 two-component system, response regulator YesN [Cohnella sp. OV330]
MTRLLIVDDEQIERDGLQAILRKGFPELDIAQAKNGKIAVEMAAELQPDLILMDIKMPGMNGLEAIEIIAEAQPGVKFVMVTAYDTFDYARSAIKLGVKDYLLKPSKASEIVATVGKVLSQIEEERRSAETSKRQEDALRKVLPVIEADIVTQLLFDHVHEVHLDELVGLLGESAGGEPFAMSVLLPTGAEGLYAAIREKARQAGGGWVGAMYGRHIPVIAFRDPARSYRSQALALARDLLSVADAGLPGAGGSFVGIGGVCDSLDQIRQSYQEALIASSDPTLPVKYRFYADTPALGMAREGLSAKQWERQFFDRIRLGQWEQVEADVQELLRRSESEGADLLLGQQRALELLWLASRVLLEMGVETESPLFSVQARDYRQLRAETALLLARMRQAFETHQEQVKPDAIQQIKQYVYEHSHEDISLEAIGKRVGLSPFYISKLFKEQLGVNYIDFLTECRIDKAKKLMGDPERSLKEITFEVGYHDPNYFSKVFKKMCDVSPTEYRKTLLGKRGS